MRRLCTTDTVVSFLLIRTHSHKQTAILHSHLFRQQAVHDEDQRPLKAVEDDEEVQHDLSAVFLEEEEAENPRSSKNTQLSHCGRQKTPDLVEFGEVWVEAGELLGQFPHCDDEDCNVEDDDDADGYKETQD